MTEVFELPVTVGVKVAVWPPFRDALPGDKLRLTVCAGTGLATGFNVSETVAYLVGSAWLVAFNTTVSCVVTLAGAVYFPLVKLPTFGVTDQVTPVLVVPDTEA